MKADNNVTEIQKIDKWTPNPEDILFTNAKGIIYAPINTVFQSDVDSINYFIMSPKKCYNSQVMRDHTCLYLNYFEKYFDPDKELFVTMARIKYLIDYEQNYSKQGFLYDIRAYILGKSLTDKVAALTEYNY